MGDGYTLFDLVCLERAEELRRARRDPDDPDAARLEAEVERKREARRNGSEDRADWT